MDQETKLDVELLLNIVRPQIEVTDNNGDSMLFNKIGKEFGLIAHRVYLSLDRPARTCENFHNKSINRVLLDPHTIINRSRSYEIRDAALSIDDLEFWNHCDMIKTLIDYLSLVYSKEEVYASA